MNDINLKKHMLRILARLDGIAVRESVFAAEVEIAAGHPITTDEFHREMDDLLGRRLVVRSFDAFGEAMYEATGDGKAVLMGK